jgi:preprotein translocase subunit SecE
VNRAVFLAAAKHTPESLIALMALTNPITFLQQVRTEVSKVTWPSRNETLISTVMVLVMVAFASIFFLVADQLIAWAVQAALSLG